MWLSINQSIVFISPPKKCEQSKQININQISLIIINIIYFIKDNFNKLHYMHVALSNNSATIFENASRKEIDILEEQSVSFFIINMKLTSKQKTSASATC